MNPPDDSQRQRRELLGLTDDLLERIEQSRLRDQEQLTPEMLARIERVAGTVAVELDDHRILRRLPPRDLHGAHAQVLAMQVPVLRGDLRELSSRRDCRELPVPGRAGTISHERIVLPTPHPQHSLDAYHEEIRIALQRAHDAVALYDAQAQAAPPDRQEVLRLRGQDARENLRDLLQRSAEVLPEPYVPSDPQRASGRQVVYAGKPISLTPAQSEYVALLAANHPHWVTREALLATHPARAQEGRGSLPVQISQARSKLPAGIEIDGREGAYRLSAPLQLEPPAPGPTRGGPDPESNRQAWRRRPEIGQSSELPPPPEIGPERDRGPERS